MDRRGELRNYLFDIRDSLTFALSDENRDYFSDDEIISLKIIDEEIEYLTSELFLPLEESSREEAMRNLNGEAVRSFAN